MTTERIVKVKPGEVIRLKHNEEVLSNDKAVTIATRRIRTSWFQKLSDSMSPRKPIKQEVTMEIGLSEKTAKKLQAATKHALKKVAKHTKATVCR
jgi:ABC-type glutathione transport system ATPase component